MPALCHFSRESNPSLGRHDRRWRHLPGCPLLADKLTELNSSEPGWKLHR
jgi:hypothetical protein